MNVGLDPSALGNLYQQVSKSQNKINPSKLQGNPSETADQFATTLLDQAKQVAKSEQFKGVVGGLIDAAGSKQPLMQTGRRSVQSGAGMPGLGSLINAVDSKQKAAMESQRAFLAGESNNLHRTMIAGQEASLAFSLMVEMRNKVMEAYQELMRLQV
jgi:flagellar hook-basal body complex protein FliE